MAIENNNNGFKKVFLLNVFILFVMGNVFYWMIPSVAKIYNISHDHRYRLTSKKLPKYYDKISWAKQHFREMLDLEFEYKSYVGWVWKRYHGQTINIEGTYSQRRTRNFDGINEKKVYFFGGSTMWGFGSNDESTIPSQFAQVTKLHTENFAQGAWNSHQSLLLLIQLFEDGKRPDLVVFYHGANDARYKCSARSSPDTHFRVLEYTSILDSGSPVSFSHYLSPIKWLAQKINRKIFRVKNDGISDCSNPAKSEAIAKILVQDWEIAKTITESHGGKFIAILEPVACMNKSQFDNLKKTAKCDFAIESVYPKIRREMEKHPQFYDFTTLMNGDDDLFFDAVHPSPKGNNYVAEKIAQIARSLNIGLSAKN